MQREKLSSRLGFILVSAGCAIGIGNVYRFPLVTGLYGGAIFVLFYLFFVVALGLPIMLAELAVGRASRLSIANSFKQMERPGQYWHLMKYLGIAGNYLLMMFYTTISGWFVIYFCKFLNTTIIKEGATLPTSELFTQIASNPTLNFSAAFASIIICFIICGFGLQKGVEKASKIMMTGLLCLLIGLAIYSCNLHGAKEGLKFFLLPSLEKFYAIGPKTVICEAMSQAFFTLSVGMGNIAIFGSYIDKDHNLLAGASLIVALDTFVAVCAGLVIFPACFTYLGGVGVDANHISSSFLFTTLCTVFKAMDYGLLIGLFFFLFMIFASFSTILAVFEAITSFWLEGTKLSRKQIVLINIILITILSLPAIFTLNIWSNFLPFGMDVITLEDNIVSSLLLPLGSLFYILFCVSRYGWGFDNFFAEVNTSKAGAKLPYWIKPYMTFVLPLLIIFLLFHTIGLL